MDENKNVTHNIRVRILEKIPQDHIPDELIEILEHKSTKCSKKEYLNVDVKL